MNLEMSKMNHMIFMCQDRDHATKHLESTCVTEAVAVRKAPDMEKLG